MRPVATPSPYSSRDQEDNCDDREYLQDGNPVAVTEQRREGLGVPTTFGLPIRASGWLRAFHPTATTAPTPTAVHSQVLNRPVDGRAVRAFCVLAGLVPSSVVIVLLAIPLGMKVV